MVDSQMRSIVKDEDEEPWDEPWVDRQTDGDHLHEVAVRGTVLVCSHPLHFSDRAPTTKLRGGCSKLTRRWPKRLRGSRSKRTRGHVGFSGEALPLPCVSTAFAAKTLPLPCVSIASGG